MGTAYTRHGVQLNEEAEKEFQALGVPVIAVWRAGMEALKKEGDNATGKRKSSR